MSCRVYGPAPGRVWTGGVDSGTGRGRLIFQLFREAAGRDRGGTGAGGGGGVCFSRGPGRDAWVSWRRLNAARRPCVCLMTGSVIRSAGGAPCTGYTAVHNSVYSAALS